ncbi:hypothetical protein ONS95_001958 [Cadophora gregata]|uniref:uncharacterized protein n=1 Tax=Cadophora gregata TaxID=51156 RepID=UPI0026DBD4E0|nr:uncharacterized protein ONS95_001958 [Cadophora gregata]KAK0111612.1 hypothetical protein ONS95_001958 [Cadophora gregata]KAK0111912.1 hypothetical protein ONS96_001179 [Cadophora gregata f. sp. sojae]
MHFNHGLLVSIIPGLLTLAQYSHLELREKQRSDFTVPPEHFSGSLVTSRILNILEDATPFDFFDPLYAGNKPSQISLKLPYSATRVIPSIERPEEGSCHCSFQYFGGVAALKLGVDENINSPLEGKPPHQTPAISSDITQRDLSHENDNSECRGCKVIDVDFSKDGQALRRPNFGEDFAILQTLPDLEYPSKDEGPEVTETILAKGIKEFKEKEKEKEVIEDDEKDNQAQPSIDSQGNLISQNTVEEQECPEMDTHVFHCGECGGPDEQGKCKGDPEYDYEFKGCDCAPDLDWSKDIPGLKRPNFGRGSARLMRLQDIKYADSSDRGASTV